MLETTARLNPFDIVPAPHHSAPRAARTVTFLAIAILCVPAAAGAEELPLWEGGLGVAVIDFPDYRGADERNTWVLPVPYFVYRGELLKADREGLRGTFFKSDRLDLHMSLNGSVPVDSSDNAARSGMSDLDPTLEIGPRLEVALLGTRETSVQLTLQLPARTVIASDFSHTRNVGWIAQPQLNADFRDTPLGEGWNLGLAAGPLFGDKRYHNYFYGVAPEFATPTRPAYVADSGYAGAQFLVALSRRFPGFWVGGFARFDTLKGASFDSSPLVRQKESFSAGFAITWVLARSQRTVDAKR